MPTAFSQSLRSLAAERFSHALLGWLPAVALLGGWVAWFVMARVAVYEVTEMARLEVDRAVYPVAAPLAGRVVATHLAVGREVQAGDLLVELDAEAQRLQLQEQRARLDALTTRLTALRKEVAAEEAARRAEQQATRATLEEAQARRREAEAARRPAEEEAEILCAFAGARPGLATGPPTHQGRGAEAPGRRRYPPPGGQQAHK